MADAALQDAERRLRKKMAARTALIAAFAAYGTPYVPKGYDADIHAMEKYILGSTSNPLDPLGDQRADILKGAIYHYYNCCP
jgi:hypothetical protein